MSETGKEPSAQGLGIGFIVKKKAQTEQLSRPSQWSPGVRALSAEEYERFTDQLARELLATCTPERIALIAAQHMIYADELRCVLEENQIDPIKIVDLVSEIATNLATEVSMTVIEARRKHISNKRADAVSAGKKDVKARAISIAKEKWREDTHQKIKTGEMAKIVFDALKNTEHSKLATSVGAVRQWIKPCAPYYATKAGPNKKC
jgi:hypothetical protein